jgi:hypothetical protein
MKSAYFTIHLCKNPPTQNGSRLKSVIYFNRIFHKTNQPPLHKIPVLPGHWLKSISDLGTLLNGCQADEVERKQT